nr:hypothetical protein [Gammaproteobacteria bacterium]
MITPRRPGTRAARDGMMLRMKSEPKRSGGRGRLVLDALSACLFAAAWALAGEAAAQAPQPQLAQGVLLVASQEIGDPSWAETVVLLLHHDSNGSLGVAINRPTRVKLAEIVPDLEPVEYAGSVFRGGPVGPTQLVFLVRNPPLGLLPSAPLIVDGIRASGDLSTLPRLVELGHASPEDLRFFAGHVEWAPGQLAREIADGFWTVTSGSAPRIFTPQPETLWRRLRHAGNELLVEQRSGDHAAAPLGGVDATGSDVFAPLASRSTRP